MSRHPMPGASHDERLELALFELGYKNQVTAIAASFLLPLIIVIGYLDSLPRPQMWYWLGAMWVLAVFSAVNRWQGWRARRTRPASLAAVRLWRRLYFIQAAAIGCAWGNLGMLFVPGNPTQNALLLVIFLGVGAGAANTAGSHHLSGMVAGTVIGIFCQLFYLSAGFGERVLPMQAILLLYMLLLVFIGRNVNRTVRESILLRFENESVLQQKTAEAARADQANRDKSAFLAAASHDLRQPVHALLLLIAALDQRVLDPAQRKLVEHIRNAGETIAALFNALMELSRLESGSEKVEKSEVCVAELTQLAVARHALQAQQKGIRIVFRTSSALHDAYVTTDRALLGRLLDNLISNALRYTQHGGVLVCVRARRGEAWLEVRDTGIGIAPDELQHIFTPYYQAGNAARDRSKGLGLGLAIVRNTAGLLGYKIDVHSQPGRGSLFRVRVHGVHARAKQAQAAPDPHHATLPDLRGARIMVVDDDDMVRHAMLTVLASWQAEVVAVADADACLAYLDAHDWRPDCVLCDYRMPGSLNGIALLNVLTDRFPHSAAVLLTGELDPSLREAAEDAGYILLAKPISVHRLAMTLAGLRAGAVPV